MKTCNKCGEIKQFSDFVKKAAAKDGHSHSCKSCSKSYASEYYAANRQEVLSKCKEYRDKNPEKMSEQSRSYAEKNKEKLAAKIKAYQLAYPDRIAVTNKAWRDRNTEKVKASARVYDRDNKDKKLAYGERYRLENKELVLARSREWAKNNPDKTNAVTAKRRAAQLKAVPKWADLQAIRWFYAEAQRMTSTTGVTHHVDHQVPLRSKLVCGLHCEDNLQILTAFDNVSKSNRHWPDMP